MSDSLQKVYRRSRTRWIAGSLFITLCTGPLGLLKEDGQVAPAIFTGAITATIIAWTVTALVWCTHRVMEEQRRREARTVAHVARLLAQHNAAGWAAYAELTENVYPITGRR